MFTKTGLLCVLLVTFVTCALYGAPINYQGRLTDSAGLPLSGTYDLRFTMFDAAANGNPVGTPWTANSVGVLNGLFTVNPEFPLTTFSGQDRWLATEVKPSGSGSFSAVTPRVRIATVPYAAFAWTVPDGSVTPAKLAADGAQAGQVLTYDGSRVTWSTPSSGFTLPFIQTTSEPAALAVTTTSGEADHALAKFVIDNASNSGVALYGTTNGSGFAVAGYSTGDAVAGGFEIEDATALKPALYGRTTGLGSAGWFGVNNTASTAPALRATTTGSGAAISASVSGNGNGGYFAIDNAGNNQAALLAATSGLGSAGAFLTNNPSNPYHGVYASTTGTGTAICGYANGNGGAALFQVENLANAKPVVSALTNGLGNAADFRIKSASNANSAVYALTEGMGRAGEFKITNSSNPTHAVSSMTNGSGAAFYGLTLGSGSGGAFGIENSWNNSPAVIGRTNGLGCAASVFIDNPYNDSSGLLANTNGGGAAVAGYATGAGCGAMFQTNNSVNQYSALYSETNGTGYAAQFAGVGYSSKGVYITAAPGQYGLLVAGGVKSGVVATTQGARALYAEEAAEVWFTDYGSARLSAGKATVVIDKLFAETVNLEERYHVFLQLEDADCEGLAVTARTPTSFEVAELRGGTSDAEFSYRIAAKRRGFEKDRLEHAAYADDDPNLYPDRRAAWAAKQPPAVAAPDAGFLSPVLPGFLGQR